MTEHPFPVRPESSWQDDAWNYGEEELNVSQKFVAREAPAYRPSDIGWWAALALVAAGGALTIVAAAFLCQVIGL